MAYYNAENTLYDSIGLFSTVGHVLRDGIASLPADWIDYDANSNFPSILPGQCQAFLTTPTEFIWFIEVRDIVYRTPESPVGTLPVSFGPKKVYPAKVTGLNLPLIRNSFYGTTFSVTVRWRDELIRYGSNLFYDISSENFRPGFGEMIPSDLSRPLKSATIQTNNLGLPNLTVQSGFGKANCVTGPLGRLMSAAFHVNETIAAKYDASQSKKKKKSLNKQTYEEIPVYPVYTTAQSTGY